MKRRGKGKGGEIIRAFLIERGGEKDQSEEKI